MLDQSFLRPVDGTYRSATTSLIEYTKNIRGWSYRNCLCKRQICQVFLIFAIPFQQPFFGHTIFNNKAKTAQIGVV